MAIQFLDMAAELSRQGDVVICPSDRIVMVLEDFDCESIPVGLVAGSATFDVDAEWEKFREAGKYELAGSGHLHVPYRWDEIVPGGECFWKVLQRAGFRMMRFDELHTGRTIPNI